MAFRMHHALFHRTKILENYIDEFHDRISEAGLVFKEIISVYLKEGVAEKFGELTDIIGVIENDADKLRRDIEARLYEQDLIPDLRADVLELIERLDELLNMYEANSFRFAVEQPKFLPTSTDEINELVDAVTTCVEKVILASRAFFRDLNAVRDHNHKVMYYESKADKLSTKIKKDAFSSDLSLAEKMHIRSFVDHIDAIANEAEDIADKLAIYTIKRSV